MFARASLRAEKSVKKVTSRRHSVCGPLCYSFLMKRILATLLTLVSGPVFAKYYVHMRAPGEGCDTNAGLHCATMCLRDDANKDVKCWHKVDSTLLSDQDMRKLDVVFKLEAFDSVALSKEANAQKNFGTFAILTVATSAYRVCKEAQQIRSQFNCKDDYEPETDEHAGKR